MYGLGLDHDDGHTRITRGKNFCLYGGSEETHSVMQETAVKINENLDKQGKHLEDVSPREFRDILYDVTDSIGHSTEKK
jgi:nitrate reductase cytochrome c-type subunit